MDANGFRETTPDDIRAIRQWLEEQGGVRPGFDVVQEGETPGDDPSRAAELVARWEEAGCTWWLESRWEVLDDSTERVRQVGERLAAGPPRAAGTTQR
jgi:hypothetical protein